MKNNKIGGTRHYPVILVAMMAFFLQPIFANASKKPKKKQLILWEQIEKAAEQNYTDETLRLCRTLISCSERYDSLDYLSHCLLAEYYLTTEDFYGVYDCYVYFREHSKLHPHQENAEQLCDRLYTHYCQLLGEDLQSQNYEGLWFSDMQGTANQPYIAFTLTADSRGEPYLKLWKGCQFYKEFSKKYNGNEGRSVDESSPMLENTDIIDSTDLQYIAQWGDMRIRKPKENAAMTLQNVSNTIHTETARAVASAPEGHFGEMIAVQAASSLAQSLIETGADLLSTSSVKSYAATINFGNIHDGEMAAKIIIDTSTIITGQTQIKGGWTINLHLYKWYPHNEITFVSDLTSIDQLLMPSFVNRNELKYYSQRSPFAYKDGNKNGRKYSLTGRKRFNDQMYVDFARERIFGQMYDDKLGYMIPAPEHLEYSSNSLETSLVGSDDKIEDKIIYKATKEYDGKITYYQMDGYKTNGLRSEYYANGEHHIYKVYDGVIQGKYLKYNSEGELLGYDCYSDGRKEGKSMRRVQQGWIEQQWNEDSIQGNPRIVYDNGDMYEGEITGDVPDGKGTMTLTSGETKTGDWLKGVYVEPVVSVEKVQKKVSQRKRHK